MESNLVTEPEYLPPLHDIDKSELLATNGPTASNELAIAPQPFRDLSTLEPGERLYTNFQDAGAFHYASKASATRRAYESDWEHFSAWCRSHNLCHLPAEPGTVVLYITELAKPTDGSAPRKPATIGRRLTSINTFHKDAKLDSPALMSHRGLSATFQGIRRVLGTAQTMKKPLTRERVVKVLGNLEGPLQAARNKALVLVGFAGALRRGELVLIRVQDLKEHKRGLTITIPKSKTDQESQGRTVEILWGVQDDTCPVLALRNWLSATGIKEGLVFRAVDRHGNVSKKGLRSDSVGRIVQKLVLKAKMKNPEAYGGHSLRAGFVTEASANGANDNLIMKQTGHQTTKMVRRYSRGDEQDKQTAVSKLGL